MPRSTEKAFSLIEAVVVIAIMAILAGAAVPLVLKGLNQQREQKTRENLQVAYEAMFGRRDKRIANMAADFGYMQNPIAPARVDLRFLTNRNLPNGSGAAPQSYAMDLTAQFFWGWNGPYWTGSQGPAPDGTPVPVDGWGRRIMLRSGPQLVSGGVDGTIGNGDDIAYPSVIGMPLTVLTINIIRTTPLSTTLNIQVLVTDRNGNATRQVIPTPPAPQVPPPWVASFAANVGGSTKADFRVNPGPVSVQITGPSTSTQVVDLLPGEPCTLSFQYNN